VAKKSEINKQQDKAAKAEAAKAAKAILKTMRPEQKKAAKAAKAILKTMTPEQRKAAKKLGDEFVRTGRVPEVKEAKT
jgi:hypothetical protein